MTFLCCLAIFVAGGDSSGGVGGVALRQMHVAQIAFMYVSKLLSTTDRRFLCTLLCRQCFLLVLFGKFRWLFSADQFGQVGHWSATLMTTRQNA